MVLVDFVSFGCSVEAFEAFDASEDVAGYVFGFDFFLAGLTLFQGSSVVRFFRLR